jgi:hypothetical protein
MTLDYLVFDYSEDAEGAGSFDAMASAAPAQWPALQAEVVRVLDWAHQGFAGVRGALDEGGDWDYALQAQREVATTLDARYDAASGRLALRDGESGPPRLTLSLTLGGTPAFCEAFRAAFGVD